jgi:hypothetical protein
MINLLTEIGLASGGSSTIHIYTQTIHRTTRNKQYLEQHKNINNDSSLIKTAKQKQCTGKNKYTTYIYRFQQERNSQSPIHLNAINVGLPISFLAFTIKREDILVYFRTKTVAS